MRQDHAFDQETELYGRAPVLVGAHIVAKLKWFILISTTNPIVTDLLEALVLVRLKVRVVVGVVDGVSPAVE